MLYPPLLETLGFRRADQVDGACNMRSLRGSLILLYTDGIFQFIVKKKGPQRQEALKEFSKYARAQVDQARQAEKVHCYCETLTEAPIFCF